MAHVDALGLKLPGQALGEIAKPALGGGECGKTRLAAQGGAGAGEDQTTFTSRRHPPQRFPGKQKAALQTHAVTGVEVVKGHVEEAAGHIVARVVNGQIERADGLGSIQQADDLGFIGRIAGDG